MGSNNGVHIITNSLEPSRDLNGVAIYSHNGCIYLMDDVLSLVAAVHQITWAVIPSHPYNQS